MRLDHVRRALLRLLADRQQPDARPRDAVHRFHERRSHVRELDEVLWPDLCVGTRVEQQRRAPGHRHERGDRRAMHAVDALDVQERGNQRRAGRSRGNERIATAVGDCPRGLDDRRVRARANGAGRLLVVADRGQRRAEELDLEARDPRTLGSGLGAVVGPVRVERDHRARLLAGDFRRDDLAAGVGAAVRTDTVRHARRSAVRARAMGERADLVGRAALVRAAVRLLLLRDRHSSRSV